MSAADPIIFASQTAAMSDVELYVAFQLLDVDTTQDYQQAVLDEAQQRNLITASEAAAVIRARG